MGSGVHFCLTVFEEAFVFGRRIRNRANIQNIRDNGNPQTQLLVGGERFGRFQENLSKVAEAKFGQDSVGDGEDRGRLVGENAVDESREKDHSVGCPRARVF